jgi:hypothetical protein
MRLRLRIEDDATEALDSIPGELEKVLREWSAQGALLTQDELRRVIREKQQTYGATGYLSNSVVFELTGSGFVVYPAADYALFVDQPTRPHEIRPVLAKALVFAPRNGGPTRLGTTRTGSRVGFRRIGTREVASSVVFVQVVHHPGTKGFFFIEETAERVEEKLVALLEKKVQEALKRIEGP